MKARSLELRVIGRFFEGELGLIEHGLCGWTVNPYPRCDPRCGYCITGAKGESRPLLPPDRIVDSLHQALRSVPPGAPISLGGISDAYPSVEEELGVSRALLPSLLPRSDGLNIVTKGRTVCRGDLQALLDRIDDDLRVSVAPLAALDAGRLHVTNMARRRRYGRRAVATDT